MPSRAILADIEAAGADPTKPHSALTSAGRLRFRELTPEPKPVELVHSGANEIISRAEPQKKVGGKFAKKNPAPSSTAAAVDEPAKTVDISGHLPQIIDISDQHAKAD